MIPIGLAATLLSNVGSAIRSGLSQLAGNKSSASTSGGSASQQPTFATHLKAATASTSTTGSHHGHLHGKGIVVSASADVVPSTSQASSTSAAVGKSIDISA
ncbi:hypothetical protein NDK50_16575 [Paraburkholderia bryophila]|uniref:hypothetical protein n=1 Tax=Paraburkholderia bryophila TaxID=420952 RepID=UPI0023493469|nr:hypothetical protein [Paraburkholderia bryophila]WCM19024.1 hypothetical protein NDK50_16575 [Paraburkholderia bryophila]